MRIRKNGTILITTLWIMAILSILAVGIAFRVSIEARLSKYNLDRLKASYIAKAGIVKACEILSRDMKTYQTIRECGIAFLGDKDPKDIFTEKLSDSAFEVSYDLEGANYYGMMDEERKININKADQFVLAKLLGSENKDALAASIMNWRGTVQIPGGAWDNDYEVLTPPYKCKHADFSVIEELMLVKDKDMTPELFESIKDYITIYGDGKVNINTASKKVMLALGLSPETSEYIIKIRNGIDGIAGTKDDNYLDSIGAIADRIGLPAYSPERTVLSDKNFKTNSDYFKIESKGELDKSRITSKIVCVVSNGAKKIDYYREY